jgi:cytochrome c5
VFAFIIKIIAIGMTVAWLLPTAQAASGEAIYKSKCSSCHDSGAGQAPRVSVSAEWREREARGRGAMYESAIKGIPATAMAAKGGYAELSDEEIRATVDYMLTRAGFRDRAGAIQAVTAPATGAVANAAAPAGAVDDATLVNRIAEALRKSLAPDARIELYAGEATLRGLNIRVGARDGVVTLSGAVEKADIIPRAQAIAQSVTGAQRVESRLIAAGMLDFD